jgi:hypothetical protein
MEIVNNLADFENSDKSFMMFLKDGTLPYYKLCQNLYVDAPYAYNSALFSLKADYKTINNYSNTVRLNNFSVAKS